MIHRTRPVPAAIVRTVVALTCTTLLACNGGGSSDNGPPAVNGPAWWQFGRNAQHAANSAIASQALARLRWNAPVDLAPQHTMGGALLSHYGSPVISARNTVILPVRTASGTARIEARRGLDGTLLWSADSDFLLPAGTPSSWTPSYGITLTPGNRVYFAGAAGKLFYRDDVDSATGTVNTLAISDCAIKLDAGINAALTVDAAGTLFLSCFGAPNEVSGRVVRVANDGTISTVSMGSLVPSIGLGSPNPFTSSAPALSPDEQTLYIGMSTIELALTSGLYLVAVDAKTLALKARVELRDPVTGSLPTISRNSTASPTVGPDGDVYFGVLESTLGAHNSRGWLLHFDAALAATKAPASFGWDDTPSIVPASMVPGYAGSSSYLLAIKYNNYANAGTGDGKNRMAVVDPTAVQTDPISGFPVMKEILTVLGPTPDPNFPTGVKEWCVNTVAVDPATLSVLVNSEDGYLYRWDLTTNALSQKIQLGSPIGEAYTPTVIGPDGLVYAINNAVLYAVGQ